MMSAKRPVLTPEDHEHFVEYGYVIIRKAVPPELIDEAVAILEKDDTFAIGADKQRQKNEVLEAIKNIGKGPANAGEGADNPVEVKILDNEEVTNMIAGMEAQIKNAVSKEDHDAVVQAKNTLETEKETWATEKTTLENKVSNLESEVAKLKGSKLDPDPAGDPDPKGGATTKTQKAEQRTNMASSDLIQRLHRLFSEQTTGLNTMMLGAETGVGPAELQSALQQLKSDYNAPLEYDTDSRTLTLDNVPRALVNFDTACGSRK